MSTDHHTKSPGDLGVFKAMVDLHERGFVVAEPLTEHSPFDLIIWRNQEAKTVQVKYRSKDDSGKVNVRFRATQWNTDGPYNAEINTDAIDVYCVYCPESDECYYFDPDRFGKSITIRIEDPKNNQTKGINFAEDFKQVP